MASSVTIPQPVPVAAATKLQRFSGWCTWRSGGTSPPAPLQKRGESDDQYTNLRTALDYINALRGMAILAVVLVHVSQYGSDTQYFFPLLQSICSQGARGVQLFFVVSAFTLWMSVANRKSEAHPTRNFFLRRFFRIAPMYWLGVVVYGIWYATLGGEPARVSLGNVASNVTFLHGTNPYWISNLVPGGWSITVEM